MVQAAEKPRRRLEWAVLFLLLALLLSGGGHALLLWLLPRSPPPIVEATSPVVIDVVPRYEPVPARPSPIRSRHPPQVHSSPQPVDQTPTPEPEVITRNDTGATALAPVPEAPLSGSGPAPREDLRHVQLFDPVALGSVAVESLGTLPSRAEYIDPSATGSGDSPQATVAQIRGVIDAAAFVADQEGKVQGGLLSTCHDRIDQGDDGWMDCADMGCRQLPSCRNTKEFNNDTLQVIPDDSTAGITSQIVVDDDDDGAITGLNMQVRLRHGSPGDIAISIEHDGITDVVVRANPSTHALPKAFDLKAFEKTSPQGVWTLHVRDLFAGGTGTLDGWTLFVTRPPKD